MGCVDKLESLDWEEKEKETETVVILENTQLVQSNSAHAMKKWQS